MRLVLATRTFCNNISKPVCIFSWAGLIWVTLRWRHNGRDSVSIHQPHDFLLKRLFSRRSKKTSKLSVTGLCVENSLGTGEFPTQMASYAENASIWWRHHVLSVLTRWRHLKCPEKSREIKQHFPSSVDKLATMTSLNSRHKQNYF